MRLRLPVFRYHVLVGLLSASVLGVGLVAVVGAHGGDETKIHGCVDAKGKIRIIQSSDACKSRETPLDWNTRGRESKDLRGHKGFKENVVQLDRRGHAERLGLWASRVFRDRKDHRAREDQLVSRETLD